MERFREARASGAERARALDEVFRKKPGETQVRLRLDKEFRATVEAICGAEAIERVAG